MFRKFSKHNLFFVIRICALILFSTPLPLIGQQQMALAESDSAARPAAQAQSAVQAANPTNAHAGSLPLCPSGQEYDAGLCYPKCQAGYYGIGPICWKYCPDGYTNDGALCRKDAIVTLKATYGRGAGTPLTCGSDEDLNGALCYPKCQAGYEGVGPVCWQVCPANYVSDGITCRRDPYSFAKDSYGRGVGTIPDIYGNCPSGKEKDAGLCYPKCADGYYGIGPVCWQYCPAGYVNDGAFCRLPGDVFLKDSYGRGAGVALHACPAGLEQDGGLCYPKCQAGYSGVGPICWQDCPAGSINDGATCRIDAVIIAKESYGRGAGSVPDCDINNIDCSGNFEVYSAFRPQPWGYNFANWGGSDKYDTSTDLDTATLVRMFGIDVCQSGNSAATCVLKASAREWRDNQLKSAEGGHCYGLAVTGQMFFAKLDKAAVYQPTAATTYDMDATAAVRAHITEMFVSQALTLTDGTASGWISGKTPVEILDLIRANLRDTPNDPYVLAIFKTENGKVTTGHAVTPFAIENRGNNVYWVHIYDNNKPNTDRYVVIDTDQNTWLYGSGSTNPADTEGAWTGDANASTMQLRLTSAHKLGGWSCPFCAKATASAAGTQTALAATGGVQFTLNGGGDLLIRDAQNHGTGWDFAAKKYINEISGASQQFILGGAGGNLSTQITLPQPDVTAAYSAYVSGDSLTQTAWVNVAMVGAGATLNVNNIALAPHMHLRLTFQPDGHLVTFNADGTSMFTPTIKLANDLSASGNGYLFDVSGITLEPSKTVTVSLDATATELHFTDDTAQANAYKVELLRITPSGQEQRFMTDNAVVSGGQDGAMNFGVWDGSGGISFTLDGQEQTLSNEATRKTFIPLVTRN